MKRCSSCLKEKPLDQFWLKRRGGDLYQYWCQSCMRGYRMTNREIEREQDRARLLRKRALNVASGGPPAETVREK